MRRFACLVAVLTATCVPAAAAAACVPQTSLADIEDEVMCPVCGTPLGLATEAPQAVRERAFIQSLVRRCRSKQEIKDRLVAEYGRGVLAMPAGKGFDLAAYLVPALALMLGGAALAAAALRWRRGRRPGPPAAAPPDAAADRLQTDLNRYEL